MDGRRHVAVLLIASVLSLQPVVMVPAQEGGAPAAGGGGAAAGTGGEGIPQEAAPSGGPVVTDVGQDGADTPPPLPPLPLRIEIEGVELESAAQVLFYGPGVPRRHFEGSRVVSERRFFEIAGEEESARQARNYRMVNIGLASLSVLSFFGGLALFGAADEIDFSLVGLSGNTPGRVLSLGLVGGSIAPAIVLMIRGDDWAPLELSYDTMRRYNGVD